MMKRLAFALLRLYPSAWRFRYDVEMRAMLEDYPPTFGDVLGLARCAISERLRSFLDPIAHPFFASLVVGLAGWLSAAFAIHLASRLMAWWLEDRIGLAPGWIANAANLALLVIFARTLVACSIWVQIPLSIELKPLGRAAARRWWIVYVVAYTFALWGASSGSEGAALQFGVIFWLTASLLESTEVAWHRRSALLQLVARRAALHAAVQQCVRLGRSAGVVAEDLVHAVQVVNSARTDLDRARENYSAAQLWRQPPSHPLGL